MQLKAIKPGDRLIHASRRELVDGTAGIDVFVLAVGKYRMATVGPCGEKIPVQDDRVPAGVVVLMPHKDQFTKGSKSGWRTTPTRLHDKNSRYAKGPMTEPIEWVIGILRSSDVTPPDIWQEARDARDEQAMMHERYLSDGKEPCKAMLAAICADLVAGTIVIEDPTELFKFNLNIDHNYGLTHDGRESYGKSVKSGASVYFDLAVMIDAIGGLSPATKKAIDAYNKWSATPDPATCDL